MTYTFYLKTIFYIVTILPSLWFALPIWFVNFLHGCQPLPIACWSNRSWPSTLEVGGWWTAWKGGQDSVFVQTVLLGWMYLMYIHSLFVLPFIAHETQDILSFLRGLNCYIVMWTKRFINLVSVNLTGFNLLIIFIEKFSI